MKKGHNKWLSFDIDDCEFSQNEAKAIKLTTSVDIGSKTMEEDADIAEIHKVAVAKSPILNDQYEQFSPESITDLCVHNKKTQEVEQWLQIACAKNHSSILLLTGPSGSGKTMTIQLLAKKMNLRISEWITPIDVDTFINFENDRMDAPPEKQVTKFCDFILKSSCYSSLLTNTRRIVLVEDFPNVFLKKPSEFHETLEKYCNRGRSPIIFICTDAREESLNLVWTLFPQTVQDKYNIHNIRFNAVSTTGLKGALKRVATLMTKHYSSVYNSPSSELVDCVINSSLGDVRSAVINLHFAALKGKLIPNILSESANGPPTTKNSKYSKTRKKDSNKSLKFNTLGKNESITILHGVGRVLNPKFIDSPTNAGMKKLSHDPQKVVEQFSIQPKIFLGFLHENYLPHFSNAHHTWQAAEVLSDADYFMNEWREKEGKLYGLQVSVSGLMLANKAPISAWNPVHGPKNEKIQYPFLKFHDDNDHQFVQGKVLAIDYKTYFEIISKTKIIKQSNISSF